MDTILLLAPELPLSPAPASNDNAPSEQGVAADLQALAQALRALRASCRRNAGLTQGQPRQVSWKSSSLC